MSIASSLVNSPVDLNTLAVGEVGLSGEVRPVPMIDRRIAEAAKMGFKTILLPAGNLDKLAERSLEFAGAASLQQALDIVLGR